MAWPLLIGAQPNTDWLPPDVERDQQGFVLTGADVSQRRTSPLDRSPFLLETSMPGVFAAGDVRHGAVRRVASAVGEGSIAIQFLHQFFAAERRQPRGRSEEHPSTSRLDTKAIRDDEARAGWRKGSGR